MDVQCVFIYLFCVLLTASTQATALVVSSPRDVKVANGTWASFECRVSCTHVFYWFVGSGRYRRLTNVDVNRFVQRNGIQVEVSRSSRCTNNGDYTQQLRILATPKVNGTAVQCAAVSRPPTPNGVFFSSYAVLMVKPIEPEVAEPTPSACSDPSPEISTSSVTVTVTETPPVIIVTRVLDHTVTVTPSPSSLPKPDNNCNDGNSIVSTSTSRAPTVPVVATPASETATDSG